MLSVVILVTILTVGILQPIITVKNCFYTMVLKITLEFLSVLKYSNFIFFFYEYNNFNVFKFFYFIFSFMRDKLFTIKITFVINLSRDNFNVQSLCIFHNLMQIFSISMVPVWGPKRLWIVVFNLDLLKGCQSAFKDALPLRGIRSAVIAKYCWKYKRLRIMYILERHILINTYTLKNIYLTY